MCCPVSLPLWFGRESPLSASGKRPKSSLFQTGCLGRFRCATTCVYAGGHSGEADIPRNDQVRGSIPSPARRRRVSSCNLCYAIALLTRPLLLVDVDGLLNPYAADTCPEGYCEFNFFEGEEPVRLADVHGKWLRELGEVLTLVWATGWGDEAP